jgi:hypothetical protein
MLPAFTRHFSPRARARTPFSSCTALCSLRRTLSSLCAFSSRYVIASSCSAICRSSAVVRALALVIVVVFVAISARCEWVWCSAVSNNTISLTHTPVYQQVALQSLLLLSDNRQVKREQCITMSRPELPLACARQPTTTLLMQPAAFVSMHTHSVSLSALHPLERARLVSALAIP